MLPEYHEADFAKQSLTCPNCNWKGTGSDAVIIDFYGVAKTQEVHCPECDETIGIIVKEEDRPPGESHSGLSFQTG